MSINVTLITVYQVINDDTEGRAMPTEEFFEDEDAAFQKSKPGTCSGRGREPKAREAVRLPDGSVRLLGRVVVIESASERALKIEREAARKKLTARERKILGV